MTRKELERTHPHYDSMVEEWQFYIRSYFGGRMYRDGNYLIQHPFESSTNYRRRRETSYYYNYCGPIVDIFTSHLFRHRAKRDYGSLTGNPLFDAFLRDSDLEGTPFTNFMRDAHRFASIYGRVSIVVDRPPLRADTVAQAQRGDIRPYLSLITPENLTDWSFVRLPSGRVVLDMVKIREDERTYRIWRRDGWEVWRIEDGGGECVLVDSGEHSMGMVPVVNLYNKRSGIRMLGISDIQDIADINRNIYYLCSDAREIIENTAFPMLALPYTRGVGEDEREIGPRNIIQFDPGEPNSKPYWLEAPHSSLSEIREWVKQDIAEIHRIAKMGGVKATEDLSQPRSGIAIELEYQQLHATLSEKADNLEQAETEILRLWAGWEGREFDGRIDYPDDFSVRDLDRDLERALRVQDVKIQSPTFRRELQKKIAVSVFPKMDEKTMKRIEEEIDGAEDV